MSAVTLNVQSTPKQSLVYTNRVYVPHDAFAQLQASAAGTTAVREGVNDVLTARVGSFVFDCSPRSDVPAATVCVSALQRAVARLHLNAGVEVEAFPPPPEAAAARLTLTVDALNKSRTRAGTAVDAGALSEAFKLQFENQCMSVGQQLALDVHGAKLLLEVQSYERVSLGGAGPSRAPLGPGVAICQVVAGVTELAWQAAANTPLELTGNESTQRNAIFAGDFNFERLNIGGLDKQFEIIMRRAFASRIFPPSLVKQLGINHVRGMLLYGPPGCGKTLIARQIGKVLNAREPKIVNGPEILDKYVGGSEEKIRALFADAEAEQASAGDRSMLHIIILDELDSICKSRGTVRDGTGVSDSVVNQLLSKMDGVDSLNNILLIGMTNRKDMIDEALLRPGRMEVHVEISLPDERGRVQIINIHTRNMRENNRMTEEAVARIPELATLTKNYSGAEIEGMVKAAVSCALSRNIDPDDMGAAAAADDSVVVTWGDFQSALQDVQPAFGAKTAELEALYRNGIVDYGSSFSMIKESLDRLVEQTRSSDRTPLMTVLLEGPSGTGKTALAAQVATSSGFPFVRLISADSMIGMSEASKCSQVHRVFMDAYKSPYSLIIIDDLERIIDYVSVGPRFSNAVLQTLLVLLGKVPPEGRKLMVVGTTSMAHLLEDLQMVQAFNVTLNVPTLQDPSEVKAVLSSLLPAAESSRLEELASSLNRPIGVKTLLMVTEMARQQSEAGDTVEPAVFLDCLHTCGF